MLLTCHGGICQSWWSSISVIWFTLSREYIYVYILCSQDTVARYQIPTIIIAGSIRAPPVHLVLTRHTEFSCPSIWCQLNHHHSHQPPPSTTSSSGTRQKELPYLSPTRSWEVDQVPSSRLQHWHSPGPTPQMMFLSQEHSGIYQTRVEAEMLLFHISGVWSTCPENTIIRTVFSRHSGSGNRYHSQLVNSWQSFVNLL